MGKKHTPPIFIRKNSVLGEIMKRFEWRPVRDHPNYAVSEYGDIINISTRRLIKPTQNSFGYPQTRMFTEGVKYQPHVHSVVFWAFNPKINKITDYEIDHIDRNVLNSHYSNLQYITKEENLSRRDFNKNK